MKKPELLINPKNVEELIQLAEAGADAFVVGDTRFALNLRGDFTPALLTEAIDAAHARNKKVYLLINAVFPNDKLKELELYLDEIKDYPLDGIRISDIGAFMLLKEKMPNVEKQFVDEMMLTNYFTVNYWAQRGMSRAKLAHELTLEEVRDIKSNGEPKIEVLIHGAPLMFTSRRKLVENYLTFQKKMGKDIALTNDQQFLYDPERGLHYPIIENEHGTHIYGGKDLCMIDDLLPFLEVGIDAFYIESATYDIEALVKIVSLYVMALELAVTDKAKYTKSGLILYNEMKKLQDEKRDIDRGFYYKPTIYKNGNE